MLLFISIYAMLDAVGCIKYLQYMGFSLLMDDVCLDALKVTYFYFYQSLETYRFVLFKKLL